ncbi:MAG: hypothetical protein ACI4VE_06510 [Clostridia bacterium]
MKYDRQYDDIINLPHHISKKHPQMSLYARSAQFAPFAALTGYEEAVKETARETNERIDIEDELKSILDGKLQIILEQIKNHPEISITYFIADSKKNGGEYVTVTGLVKKVDLYNQYIYLIDYTEIPINEIIDISGDIFKVYE